MSLDRENYRVDSRTILIEQLNRFCTKHQQSKTQSTKNEPDPVSIQLFVHDIDRYQTLPPISISKSEDTQRTRTQQKSTQRIINRSLTKHRARISLTQDAECTRRFKDSERSPRIQNLEDAQRRKKFVEIDILTLLTNYAKQTQIESHLEETRFRVQGGQKFTIPQKDIISSFIKNYKFTNEHLNLQDLIRSPYFTVKFTDRVSLYFGDFKEGDMDGRGVMLTPTWIFEGEWIRSQKACGVQITQKGTYKGKFTRNQRSKMGEFYWKNGEYYSGQWLHNQKHGTGVWKSPEGDVYMGQWAHGKVEGYGIHLTRSGQKYEGFFQKFLKHGQGKQYFPNGDFSEGIFKKGKPQGTGCYKWKNGIVYEGEFRQGLRQGKGKISNASMQYQGSFQKQRAHGQGKLTVWNGNGYRGQFRRGKKEGKGICRQNKKIYVGTWKNDRFLHSEQ